MSNPINQLPESQRKLIVEALRDAADEWPERADYNEREQILSLTEADELRAAGHRAAFLADLAYLDVDEAEFVDGVRGGWDLVTEARIDADRGVGPDLASGDIGRIIGSHLYCTVIGPEDVDHNVGHDAFTERLAWAEEDHQNLREPRRVAMHAVSVLAKVRRERSAGVFDVNIPTTLTVKVERSSDGSLDVIGTAVATTPGPVADLTDIGGLTVELVTGDGELSAAEVNSLGDLDWPNPQLYSY